MNNVNTLILSFQILIVNVSLTLLEAVNSYFHTYQILKKVTIFIAQDGAIN